MRRSYFYLLLALCAVALATSCETTEEKKVKVDPPVAAQAPEIKPAPAPPPAPKVQEPPPAPKVDPVEQMVAAAEKEYQAGRANYSAGHLEAAKENFDKAFNLLLSGPVPIKRDERLQTEFDKIVEGVNQLELLALKAGDGFTEQRAEPAPIEEANEVTFPVDPNIKAMAEAELKSTRSDLPLTINDAVASYINYFNSRGRGTLERGYVRSGRYREMIQKTFREEGVPQDLIYLAQAESGFHPLALSRAGARGMWQFMAWCGQSYGLNRTWWTDDRQDPVKATRAAARHLKDLYNDFGDWYLALAAYNSGPGTVQRAVERTGYADYWELYRRGVLPAETRNYVPIILAITIISKNPAQYGLQHLKPDPPLPYDTVNISYPVDLRLVGECVDSSVATLQELNPSLLRLTTPKDQPFDLRVPIGSREKYEQAIAAIPADMRVWWRYHRVQPGDTLGAVARKFRTTVAAIQQANNLESSELRADTKLIIPITPGRADSDMTFSKRATRYKVRKGDTVLSVADDFGVPAQNLRKWNRLKGNTLKPGRVLLIYRPASPTGEPSQRAQTSKKSKQVAAEQNLTTPKLKKTAEIHAPKAGKPVTHKVKKGETLYSIANAYKVTVADLRRLNGKRAANLQAGTILIIK